MGLLATKTYNIECLWRSYLLPLKDLSLAVSLLLPFLSGSSPHPVSLIRIWVHILDMCGFTEFSNGVLKEMTFN